MSIKEILPTGRDVVDEDGNVRSRHDFPRDDYPETEDVVSVDEQDSSSATTRVGTTKTSSVKHPKPGYVRDFHDGGRADEHRGGVGAPELESVAMQSLKNALPELKVLRDTAAYKSIVEEYLEELSEVERGGEDRLRSAFIARWRSYLERHNPSWSEAQVNDEVVDFEHALRSLQIEY